MGDGRPAVVHWDINARDAERLWSFYAGVFNWDFKSAGFSHPYRYLEVEPGSQGIGGGIGQAPDGNQVDGEERHLGLTVYVRVPDLRASFERAMSLGATPMWGPSQIHDGLALAMIRDPEGNAIGLMSDRIEAGESSPDESRSDL